ncbi:hypothetical protein [Croceicoccus sediminis]|uniref:hypothetical protein n=1 Tax=Croceicoccus sediminis TaxID=2571150 RepID=UPI00118210DC|nr:hypothetical protein [Croceicoccus sediminis]
MPLAQAWLLPQPAQMKEFCRTESDLGENTNTEPVLNPRRLKMEFAVLLMLTISSVAWSLVSISGWIF